MIDSGRSDGGTEDRPPSAPAFARIALGRKMMTSKPIITSVIALTLSLVAPISSAQTIIHVDDDAPTWWGWYDVGDSIPTPSRRVVPGGKWRRNPRGRAGSTNPTKMKAGASHPVAGMRLTR